MKEDRFRVVTKRVVWKITYGVAALLLLLVCFFAYRKQEEAFRTQVDILFLGDSLVGLCRDETSVPCLVGEELGKSVYNGAMGGTCLSKVNRAESDTFQKNGISFAALSYALAYEDFGWQKSARIRQVAAEHFPEVLQELAGIDMQKVEYLIIEYGTNDYFGGVPIDNPENPYDMYTFEGALRSSLEVLKEAFPELRIILLTPTYNWYNAQGDNCENIEFGGGYLEGYVNTILRLAKEYEVECLDLYTDFYPRGEYTEGLLYTTDGIHPNEAGREKIAAAIAEYIRNY